MSTTKSTRLEAALKSAVPGYGSDIYNLLPAVQGATAPTALTDNTAGSGNTTLQALADGTTYANDVAAIRNNFADLALANNTMRAALITAGVFV